MPIENYGVLKGKILAGKEERYDDSPHYQILIEGEKEQKYRVAVNVMSKFSDSQILYLANEKYQEDRTKELEKLEMGFTEINKKNRYLALDYIRGNMIKNRNDMELTLHDKPGPQNDLNDFIHTYITNSKNTNDTIYVFGSKFGPLDKEDWIFDFYPLMGMHNVHMNQGNRGRWREDNGIWQDGAIFIQRENQWIAIFLAFLTQSFKTDDKGNPM